MTEVKSAVTLASRVRSGLDEELRALPPVFGLAKAAPHLDVARSTIYDLAKRNKLPIPVLRIGSRMKVRRSDLLAYLGITDASAA